VIVRHRTSEPARIIRPARFISQHRESRTMSRIVLISLSLISTVVLIGCGGAEKGKNKDYGRPKSTESK